MTSTAQPNNQPRRLKGWQVTLYKALLPITVALFLTGVFELFVISDVEQRHWVSRTTPAEIVRRLISTNTVFLAVPFNGGVFGFIFLLDALRRHARASSPAPPKLSRQQRRHPDKAKDN